MKLSGFYTVATLAVALSAPLTSSAHATPTANKDHAMTHTLNIGSSTLAFTKSGSGPTVIIIHGIGGHKEDWKGLAAVLAPKHTVYAVDMLGFGESSKTGAEITIADQVNALIGLLDSEHVKTADLVGNSVGGWVAATFAANHPDRTHRLILVDAAGFKAMFEGQPPVDFYPKDNAAEANLLAHVRFDESAKTPAKVEEGLAASQASGDSQAAEAVGKGMFNSPRLEEVCDRITNPTLIIWGANDGLFPTAIADLVVGHVRGSTRVLIPNASHFPQLDNPAAFNAAVTKFLK